MERTNDGERTWGMWKTAVLGLPLEALHRYLRDSEHFSPEKIATFAGDTAIRPADWESSSEAAAALDRFFAWKKEKLDRAEDVGYQEARAALLPESNGD